jgi:hypothetical protein
MQEIILKGKEIFEAAEVFELSGTESGVEFEYNKLKNIFEEESKGVALRASGADWVFYIDQRK